MTFTTNQIRHDYLLDQWVMAEGNYRRLHQSIQAQPASIYKHLSRQGLRRRIHQMLDERGVFVGLPDHVARDASKRAIWFQHRHRLFLRLYQQAHFELN